MIRNTQVYNNVVYANGLASAHPAPAGIVVGNGAIGTKIWNNTIYGNNGYGLDVQSGSNGPPVNTVVQNNILFGNGRGAVVNSGTETTLSKNLTTDPGFVNPSTGDFGIQAGSPAIDKGVTLAEVKEDFTGKARPEGAAYDIGAFEGAGSKADALPGAPAAGFPAGIGGTGGAGGGIQGIGNCFH